MTESAEKNFPTYSHLPKGCFFSGQNFSNYDIQYVNWGTSLFDVDTPCIFNAPAYNKSNEKSVMTPTY